MIFRHEKPQKLHLHILDQTSHLLDNFPQHYFSTKTLWLLGLDISKFATQAPLSSEVTRFGIASTRTNAAHLQPLRGKSRPARCNHMKSHHVHVLYVSVLAVTPNTNCYFSHLRLSSTSLYYKQKKVDLCQSLEVICINRQVADPLSS